MGTRDMSIFVQAAIVSGLGWESKNVGLWTHQKSTFSGAHLHGANGCQMISLSPRLQVKRNSASQALWRQSCLVRLPELGLLPRPVLRLHTVLPPQTSGSVGNPILFPGREILAYTGHHVTLWALLSLCNVVAGSIYTFLSSMQWLWLCMNLEESQIFLQVSHHW